MIDRVQLHLEELAVELESYRTRKIFTTKQIAKIIENRRKFEYKLERSEKKISDFVFYINSEKKLEKIRNKIIISKGTGFEDSDNLLQSNIIKIYQKGLFYFNEPFLLKEFTEYCIKHKALDEMKKTIAEKCLKNLTDTDMWIFCAQKLWEIGDIDGARSLFMKNTSVNSDPKLYIEFFRLEVLYCNKLNSINSDLGVAEEDKDDIERGKVALLILEEYVKKHGKKHRNDFVEISKLIPGLNTEVEKII